MSSRSSSSSPRATPSSSRVRRNASPLLSNDEKRQLILAHAERRHRPSAARHFSAWAGVGVVVMGIMIVWGMTVGTKLKMAWSGSFLGDVKKSIASSDGAARTAERQILGQEGLLYQLQHQEAPPATPLQQPPIPTTPTSTSPTSTH